MEQIDYIALIKDMLLYNPFNGKCFWARPPINHNNLIGSEAGTIGDEGRIIIRISGKGFRRSRIAFVFMTGCWPTAVVDHINGNASDDRWVNLRDVSIQLNNRNICTGRRKKKSNLPVGVRVLKNKRYMARIGLNGRSFSLGVYDTITEAKSAYIDGKNKYHGGGRP